MSLNHLRARARRARERGVALIWALFASVVIAGIIFTGTDSFLAVGKMGQAEFSADGQARAVAEAGLVDALAWFRRQTTQPVTTFAPSRNLLLNPPVNETDDVTLGLVRDYEIMPSLWGRYEVLKPVAGETWTDGNGNGVYDYGEAFVDANANGRRDPARNIRDISTERGFAGAGSVWRLESRGTIYRRPDMSQALGAGPNTRIASTVVASEIRRMVIVPPAQAALCVKTASGVVLGTRTRVVGGTKGGLVTKSLTGTPATTAAEMTGTPAVGTIASYDDSVATVFGASLDEMRAMADAVYVLPANFPTRIGDYTLNIVGGAVTFDAAKPLRGTGVVIVDGNATFNSGSNSFFNGVLYVKGNLVMRAPIYMRGTVIVTGTVDVAGSGGDYTELNYDGGIVSSVLTILGQYRFATAPYVPAPRLPDGTPDEEGLVRLQKSGRTLPGGNLPTALGSSLPPP